MASATMPTPPPTQQPAPDGPQPSQQLPKPRHKEPRKVRKDCKYNARERAIIYGYKERYMATTSHHQRTSLLRQELLPEIHTYWLNIEGERPSKEEVDRRTDVRSRTLLDPSALTLSAAGTDILHPQQLAGDQRTRG
jgi:hypothetical protein